MTSVLFSDTTSYSAAEFSKRMGAMKTYVGTVGEAVVGFCTIRIDSAIRAEVLCLYVDSGHRGTDIGSGLLRHAQPVVLRSHPGLATLYLDTVAPEYNQGSWERMGYRYTGPSTCDYPNGKIPAVRLEK